MVLWCFSILSERLSNDCCIVYSMYSAQCTLYRTYTSMLSLSIVYACVCGVCVYDCFFVFAVCESNRFDIF